MAREQYEEVAFQVVVDEDGALRSGYFPTGAGIVSGNIAVDYVWGNFPLQPNDDRSDQFTSIGGGDGDNGWDSTGTYTSDTLRTANYSVTFNNVGSTVSVPADSHTIATTGYSNFPGYIPNYAGDGDTGAETVVPKVIGLTATNAEIALGAANLDWSYATVTPVISAGVAAGATVTFTVDSSYNIKVGDYIWFDSVSVGETPYGVGYQTVTAVTATSISFANTAEWTFDDVATGEVWGVNNDSVRIIDQEFSAGTIVNAGTVVGLEVLFID